MDTHRPNDKPHARALMRILLFGVTVSQRGHSEGGHRYWHANPAMTESLICTTSFAARQGSGAL